MKVNKTYQSLLDKSLGSMLSAIEIYNKPNFLYREETFAILAVNAWELLFKAFVLKCNKYKLRSIYELRPAIKKNGEKSVKKVVALNRSKNPKTKSIFDILTLLYQEKKIKQNLKENIEALIELRDNSIHFINENSLIKPVQELGFACIKNYMSIIKEWELPINLDRYNLYLMPLAYIDNKTIVEATITAETKNFIDFIKEKLSKEDKKDSDYNIAISINVDFKKGNSFDSIGFKLTPDGIPISITEENIRKKYPLTYKEVVTQARERYVNFKQNKSFNAHMKSIKSNEKLCHIRKLDRKNPKTAKQEFYSTNIFSKLDEYYKKK